MQLRIHKMHGFTLTEVLVALVINAFLFLTLISLFTAVLDHYNKTLNTAMLNDQLQSAMQVMSDQIRRAGYWANAQNDVGTNTNTNPFMQTGTDLTSSGSCILFSYDRDSDGALPTISASYDDERYGFRLQGSAIQSRTPGSSFSCAASANAWEDVTDSSVITVTALTFTTSQLSVPSGTHSLLIRSVNISVTGNLVSDSSITKTITQQVRVMNDKYVP